MKGKKFLLEGVIALSREDNNDNKVGRVKFEIGDSTTYQIKTEDGKRILILNNLPIDFNKS